MSIEVKNITKNFGNFRAINDVSFQVQTGELVALMGPSGSGKTTLLRVVAGLEFADSGKVLFHGEDTTAQAARERRVGFVFQHYALFRHMNVFDNVAFGLKVRPRHLRSSKDVIRKKVFELLKLVQLERLAERFPSQLSGGQRQRVALARALAVEPKVMLLDEPFGALDAKVRKDLRRWLRKLHDELHVTSLFVTHDQEEALEVADRVVVMNEGRVEQIGTSDDVYHHPVNSFVYDFLGNVNLFHARIEGGKTYFGASSPVPSDEHSADKKNRKIYVRPHLLDISYEPYGDNYFRARIIHINPAGPFARIELISEWGDPVQVEIAQERYRTLDLKKNANVYVIPREVKMFGEDYSI